MAEIDNLDEIEEEIDGMDEGLVEMPTPGFFTKKRVIISVIIIAVLIGGGALGYFILGDQGGQSDNKLATLNGQQFFQGKTEFNKTVKKKKRKKRRLKKIKYVNLFKQLTGKQLSDVLRELSYKNILYNIIQNGKKYDVTVDSERLEEAKKVLAIKGLPTGPVQGYEIFDEASNLGVTEFDKRIRLTRALAGEMEKAIMKFEAIDNAQVEIVMPEAKLFAVTQPPVTASILIRKAPDSVITDEIVYAIIQLVSNSIEGLNPNNMSVVDTEGRVISTHVLSRMKDKLRRQKLKYKKDAYPFQEIGKMGTSVVPSLDEIMDWFEIKHSYETLLERKAMTQLGGVLPADSYKVAVTIDLGSVKKSGNPDIKRITTSVVVDNARDDIELEAYTIKQINNAVAGAIGYVRGRDTILLSRADFIPKAAIAKKTEKKTKKKKLKKKKESQIQFKNKLKYWPIPAMGFSVLFFLMFLYKGIKKITNKILGKEEDTLEKSMPTMPDTITEIQEAAFEEIVSDSEPEKEEQKTESNLEKVNKAVADNPEAIAKLLQEWLQEEQTVEEPGMEEEIVEEKIVEEEIVDG